jgi:hypothetical protein
MKLCRGECCTVDVAPAQHARPGPLRLLQRASINLRDSDSVNVAKLAPTRACHARHGRVRNGSHY